MRRNSWILIALALLLSGCIQLELLLKLKKDGSGTLVETVLFDAEVIEDFLKRLPPQGQQSRPWEIDEPALRAAAERKGKGVEFAKAEPVVRGKLKGYTATYTFADVRKVSIDPDPGKHAPKGPSPQEDRGDPMRFDFKRGKTSELIVKIPREKETSKEAPPREINPGDEGFDMMRGLMKDMKVQIQVEVDGKVEKSTAKFREGNRFTLVGLDFNSLIEDGGKLAKVMNAGSYEEAAKVFNSVPGMKIETQKEVRVTFK